MSGLVKNGINVPLIKFKVSYGDLKSAINNPKEGFKMIGRRALYLVLFFLLIVPCGINAGINNRDNFISGRIESVGNGEKINPGTVQADSNGTAALSWTAPGDDSTSGVADHYVIRYSTTLISELNWDAAITVGDPPQPLPAGQAEHFTVNGLEPGVFYYFAIKSYDSAGNVSLLSNVASGYSSGIVTPAPSGITIDSDNGSVEVFADAVESPLPLFYEFALDTSSLFHAPIVGVDMLADSVASSVFGNLAYNRAYYWRCRAVASNRSDSSSWSQPDSFVILDTQAPAIAILCPVQGDTIRGDSVTVTWRAHDNDMILGYRVEYYNNPDSGWLLLYEGPAPDSGSGRWPCPDPGNFGLRISCVDRSGNIGRDSVFVTRVAVDGIVELIPEGFGMLQSYPNPFNPSTTIKYSIPQSSHVRLEVFDLLGSRVAILIDKIQEAGTHQETWTPDNLASGVYLYKIEAGNYVDIKKMTLLR
jgi:hypothetical protein